MATIKTRHESENERLDRLEKAAIRAKRLTTLLDCEGWDEMRVLLEEQQEQYDRTILAMAKGGTLDDRELHRYEDTSRAIRLFLMKPDQVQKTLETLLRKVERAQPDEGDS